MESIFCISLDFEKYWGIHDVSDWQSKREELAQVEQVVSRLLQAFEKHEIHASWATVGLLMHESWEEIKALNQGKNIPYTNSAYSPFPLESEKYKDIPDNIVTAQKEISRIKSTAGQEIASHTYSHYYTLEEGQTSVDYMNDLADFKKVIGDSQSIVFPRNQINDQYLQLQSKEGFLAYRGNQENNLWSNSPYASEGIVKKGKRFLDAYYNVANTQSKSLSDLEIVEGLVNIPANRFLRPRTGKNVLEKRKVNRIKDELSSAAEKGHIYHLWWHPHNFTARQDEHFAQLDEILSHFTSLKTKYGMTSLNMTEIGSARKA